jgi:hypothetical protein
MRILAQITTEYTDRLLLATLGAVSGVLLAWWVVNGLLALVVSTSAPVHAVLNTRVLAFTLATTLVAGVLFGLAPVLHAWRIDLLTAIKSGSRSAGFVRHGFGAARTLVALQIAVSLVLLVGANLFARSLLNLEQQPLGFEPDRVLLSRINPRLAGYKPTAASAMYKQLYDRLNAPGNPERDVRALQPAGWRQ